MGKMNKGKEISNWMLRLIAIGLFIGIAGAAQAATVTFSTILDGNGIPALFDPSTTIPDPSDGNTLIIGLLDFTANGETISAVDTLSLMISAPAGYFITSLSYTEEGIGNAVTGIAVATGSIVVNNFPVNFPTQVFSPGASGGWSISPTLPDSIFNNETSVMVSITNSLFAHGATADEIAKTFASLTVGLTPVPVPSSIFLLGGGLFAILGTMRRRRG